jgi:predicted secreted protein
MNIVSVVVIFVIWWWIAFLAVLPMGVKGRWETPDDGVDGADPGAPENPQLKRKAMRATWIAAALTVVTSAVILSGLIDFRE